MTIFNASGHELTQGEQAVSAKHADILIVRRAVRSYTCNDCRDGINPGELHGSPEFPPFNRHVCADCLRNKSAWEFDHKI